MNKTPQAMQSFNRRPMSRASGKILLGACIALLLPLAGCGQKKEPVTETLSPVDTFNRKLQEAFGQYHPAIIGAPELQTVELNRSSVPLIINNERYDGISFTYTGSPDSDFVWAFQAPGDDLSAPFFATWFIMPETGRMSGGFSDKNWRIRKHSTALQSGSMLHIQAIDGSRFENGKRYFIYFAFRHDKPVKLTYRAALKPLRADSNGSFLIEDMAQALRLDLSESVAVR